MEGIIRHEVNNSYLIMKEEAISDREDFLLRMITENQIPGLLQATRNQLNAEGEIYYNVNGYVSFSEYCGKNQLGQQDLKKLLLALQEIIKQMEKYLLDADSLLLDPDNLFLSPGKEVYGFCLYPFAQRNIRRQIQELGEYLLNHINHEDEKVVRAAYQFYRFTREENFEIQQIVEELIRDINVSDIDKQTDTIVQTEEIGKGYRMQFETTADKKISPNTKIALHGKDSTRKINSISYNSSPDKELTLNNEETSDIQHKKSVYPFFICLSLASFVFFIYTCMIKNYYYGYSFISMLSTAEVKGSLSFFAVTCLCTLFLIWKNKAKMKKEVVEVSGA